MKYHQIIEIFSIQHCHLCSYQCYKAGYNTYAKNNVFHYILKQYFRQKWMEEEWVTLVGNYWDRKGQNENDMIALNDIDKIATVAEIKCQRRKFSHTELAEKTATLNKELSKYSVTQVGLSMEDM